MAQHLHTPSNEDRLRLHRAFIRWTGRADVADDLAQETLFEAWRSTRQPDAADDWNRWLFGVARNVLLRYRRDAAAHGVRLASPPESARQLEAAATDDDLDALMTRGDIVSLLDDALGRLPAESRQAILLKYIDELPQAEVAARLGIKEKALEGRLVRGKRAMHSWLLTERPDSAISLGIVDEPGVWVETDMWCETCGRQRLVGRVYESGGFRIDCPSCDPWGEGPQRSHIFSSSDCPFNEPGRARPDDRTARSFRKRVDDLVGSIQGPTAGFRLDSVLNCKWCGHPYFPHRWEPWQLPEERRMHMQYICSSCGKYSGVSWIPANYPSDAARKQWWSAGDRIRMRPPELVAFDNRVALRSTWDQLNMGGMYRVFRDRDSYAVVAIEIDGCLIRETDIR